MHYQRLLVIVALPGVAAYCQTPAEQPSFEVASIRQSVADPTKGIRVRARGGPGSKDPTRFTTENFSLTNLVTMAYGISHWQLSAPGLQGREMFDVAATMPEETTKEQFKLMLQRLLAERFQLKVHWDTKEMPMYELVVAKNGPKFKEAKGVEEPKFVDSPSSKPFSMKRDSEGYPELVPGRTGMMMMNGRARMQAMNETMEHFAGTLSGQVAGPVRDATGLTGKYDIALYWSTGQSPGRAAPPSPDGKTPEPDYSSGPTLFEALKDQLGLSLEKKKGSIQVLVVDHAEKVPTAN